MKAQFKLSILALLLALSVQAQQKKVDHTFHDNQAYFDLMEKEAAANIGNGKFLTPQDAVAQLKANANKRVKVQSVKPATKELSAEAIAERALESTVVVSEAYLCGKCDKTHVNAASGYVIDEDGLIVTNHHVVEAYADTAGNKLLLQIMTANGKVYPVMEVLTNSKENDLAILRVDTKGEKLKPFGLGNTAKLGADVFVLSNPNNMLFYFSKGIVARNYMKSDRSGNSTKYPEMEITADYAAGSSGAPVVDNKGNLIGTVSTTSSIYYNPHQQRDLQMVVKGTKPVITLKELIN